MLARMGKRDLWMCFFVSIVVGIIALVHFSNIHWHASLCFLKNA